jgi:hypothetical protein
MPDGLTAAIVKARHDDRETIGLRPHRFDVVFALQKNKKNDFGRSKSTTYYKRDKAFN